MEGSSKTDTNPSAEVANEKSLLLQEEEGDSTKGDVTKKQTSPANYGAVKILVNGKLISDGMKSPKDTTLYVSIDEMLVHVGEYGLYQKMVNLILCVMTMPPLYHIMIMYFAADDPPWKCIQHANSTCHWNGSFPNTDTRRCRISDTDWTYDKPREYSLVTYFHLRCDDRWKVDLVTSIFFLGWLLGAFVLGWFCDNFGRRIILIVSTSAVIVTGFVTVFMPSIFLVIVCRFVIGFFLPGTMIQSFIIISELVGARYRPFAGLMIFVFGISAISLTAVKAYFITNWKHLHIYCTLPYLVGVLLYLLVPESIRFLRVKGKMSDLRDAFDKIARWNKTEIPHNVEVSAPSHSASENTSNLTHLFRTRTLAARTVVQIVAYFVSGLVYYGVFLAAKDMGGNFYWDFLIISASEIPLIFFSMDFCERFGRKFTTTAPMALACVVCVAIAYTPSVGEYKYVRVTLGMIGKCMVGSNMNTICTWSSELYTTQMRSIAMGFFQAFIRLGAAFAPWLHSQLKQLYGPLPFLFMGAASLLAFVMLLVLPETRGTVTGDEDGEEEKEEKEEEDMELQKSGSNVTMTTAATMVTAFNNNNNINHEKSHENNALEIVD